MEQRALSTPAASTSKAPIKHEDRNTWVLTAYGITGLTLFGVLAYYVSTFIAR
jgi:hypothetical protein